MKAGALIFLQNAAKRLQVRINRMIPGESLCCHHGAIKQMIRAVCFGVPATKRGFTRFAFSEMEQKVDERITLFKNRSSRGAATGAGGILFGTGRFSLWLTVKNEMLFEVASLYGLQRKGLQRATVLIVH